MKIIMIVYVLNGTLQHFIYAVNHVEGLQVNHLLQLDCTVNFYRRYNKQYII